MLDPVREQIGKIDDQQYHQYPGNQQIVCHQPQEAIGCNEQDHHHAGHTKHFQPAAEYFLVLICRKYVTQYEPGKSQQQNIGADE